MEGIISTILKYLAVFATGGALCLIGQLLINYTKLTPARILVLFLVLGVILQAVGVYQAVVDFGNAGATIPIIGFGYSLAKGAMEGAKIGFLEAISGGFKAVTIGIDSAIFFAYIFSLIFRSRTKKC
ncbi:MAG: SpoVA/SpoVAEb family sporulation membrane protein [Clostridiales bacterium]|nr:SpoVA/SpoVAEb family sporulation membrane protein [Clostridiales bacterium]